MRRMFGGGGGGGVRSALGKKRDDRLPDDPRYPPAASPPPPSSPPSSSSNRGGHADAFTADYTQTDTPPYSQTPPHGPMAPKRNVIAARSAQPSRLESGGHRLRLWWRGLALTRGGRVLRRVLVALAMVLLLSVRVASNHLCANLSWSCELSRIVRRWVSDGTGYVHCVAL